MTQPTLTLMIEHPGHAPLLIGTATLDAADVLQKGFVEAGPLAGSRWRFTLRPTTAGRWQGQLLLLCTSSATLALSVRLSGLGEAPRWLIPATFYDENRPADSPRRYPRFGDDDDPWSALAWCVSAERAAMPFTSVRTTTHSAALLAADTYWGQQPIGLGLDAADTTLLLRWPWAETPRSDAPCRGDDGAPQVAWREAGPGQELLISFEAWIAPAATGPLYGQLLRALPPTEPDATRPLLPMQAAASLLAEGLLHWHYDQEAGVLAETCAFDHYFRPTKQQTDRAAMHVAWLSGVPTAFALLRQGGDAEAAGRHVIDHIVHDGIAPCGAFWAQWTPEGWGTCWYGPPDGAPPWLQATTTAEATLFLLQAIGHEREAGRHPSTWEQAALRNLYFACAKQRDDGNLGAYYDAQRGDVTLWEGTAGMLWIAPLVGGWHLTGDAQLLETALRAARFYAPLVLGDQLRGAPEDVPLGPSSMDGYCALRAFWELYLATGEGEWLAVARHAADWTLTFRWRYNVRFDQRTFLGSYDFRTVGADGASPSNQHLHVYGMIVLPELLALWRETGDELYFEASRDLLGFARQTLIRVDGECNGRRGMLTEQWYHADWTHPQGSMLQLAHAWCNGLVIYGLQEAHRWGQLWLGERVWCLEPRVLAEPNSPPRWVPLRNPFDEPLALRVRLLAPWQRLALDGVPLTLAHDDLGTFAEIVLLPGQEALLAAHD